MSPGAAHGDHHSLADWSKVDAVITEALERGEVTVTDTREAARSVVARIEGQVLFAKLYNNTHRLSHLWPNLLALLGARAPQGALAGT